MVRDEFASAIEDGLMSLSELTTTTTSAATDEPNLNDIRPPDLSDAGNAEVFVRVMGDRLLYADALGWLFWDGKRWEENDHRASALAQQLTGAMLDDAKDTLLRAKNALAAAEVETAGQSPDLERLAKLKAAVQEANRYLSHVLRSRNANRIRAMAELSIPYLHVRADELDPNPFDLNTPSGIVDLQSGKMRPPDPTALCTKITAVSPGTAGLQEWMAFIDKITCGDRQLAGFLQMTIGSSLIGTVYHEGVNVWNGGGRNGKSTLGSAVGTTLGTYSLTVDSRLLTTERQNRGAAMAELRGRRFVTCSELEESSRLSESTLKKLASTDNISIEPKFRQPESVRPSHHLFLHTNFLPKVGSRDDGTWRRLLVVPFDAQIAEGEAVQNYAEQLTARCGPAILTWAIKGAMLFAQNSFKLTIPDCVEEATEAWRDRDNWLRNFLGDCCTVEVNATVRAGELYDRYKFWARDSGEYVRRAADFNAALLKAGFKSSSSHRKVTWHGLKLERPENLEFSMNSGKW